EQQLALAHELSVTAPWSESEAVLDQIEHRLTAATPVQRAEFWLIRARNQTLAGNLETSLEQLDVLFEKPLTVRQRVRAHALAATAAMLLRRWEETFGHLSRALELADELELEESAVVPFSLAAYVYAMIGETGQAIDYGQRGVAIARQYGSARDVCIDQGRLAYVYKVAHQFELARRNYDQALSKCLAADDDLVTGSIESGLADLLRAIGHTREAEVLFERAIARLKTTNWRFGLAEAQLYKARLNWEQGKHEQVEILLEKALPPMEQDQAWDYVAEAHEMLSNIENNRGNHVEALKHMRQQLSARERFLDLERARQLANLQVAFDMRSREQELALLREQRRVADLQSESRRNRDRLRWLIYVFAAFLFLVLVLLLLHVLRDRRHFRRLAGLDGLTGLSNHTRFFDSARMMIDEAGQTGRSIVLIIGDIDYFKRVNDEFGHIAGDKALRKVAQALRESFPKASAIGRIGGEEFAICLPDESIDSVMPRLDSVRSALAGIDYGGNGKPLTMSFGVAELKPDEALEDVRIRTDEALYRAKRRGRNLIVAAD
ncbi:MAG TPA: diguanylate cyclase, partial [Wenzhouxiangella sp.]|nr:diguanylate cyclase [Wenzhouxiangella sp.]